MDPPFFALMGATTALLSLQSLVDERHDSPLADVELRLEVIKGAIWKMAAHAVDVGRAPFESCEQHVGRQIRIVDDEVDAAIGRIALDENNRGPSLHLP